MGLKNKGGLGLNLSGSGWDKVETFGLGLLWALVNSYSAYFRLQMSNIGPGLQLRRKKIYTFSLMKKILLLCFGVFKSFVIHRNVKKGHIL